MSIFNFSNLLIIHSYFRWIVLLMMLVQIVWIWTNKKRKKEFSLKDFRLLLFFTLIFDTQLLLGWLLYCNSILVDSFWQDVAAGVKQRQMRFFGLEHMSMMTLGIIIANVHTFRSSKNINNKNTFQKLWKVYIWIYIIILSSIPWSFSPLTSRPDFR